MKKFIKGIFRFFQRLSDDHVSVYAAYATLFIIISVFPFLMLLISVGQTVGQLFMPLFKDSLVEIISQVIPSEMNVSTLIMHVINDLYEKTSGTLISITAVTALWSASSGVYGLLIGLNSIYHTKDQRMWLYQRAICIFYTIVFIVIILLALILLVYGNKLQEFLLLHLPVLQKTGWLITLLRNMIMLIIMVIFFNLIYYVFPAHRSHFLDQLPGAVFSSLGWVLFSYGFSIYVEHFSNYSIIYGSLSGIVLTILWLYICMHIILIGGEINTLIFENGLIQRVKQYEPYIDPNDTKL